MRPLDQQGTTGVLSGIGPAVVDRFPSETLPVRYSDAVAVGSISGYQSFFSADHTTIYTELYFQCKQVLKDVTGRIRTDMPLAILKRGGVVEANGQTFKVPRLYDGSEPLEIGIRYVLFLRYSATTNSFDNIDGWKLQNDRALPLIYLQRAAVATDNALLMYTESTEEQFLGSIKEKINKLTR